MRFISSARKSQAANCLIELVDSVNIDAITPNTGGGTKSGGKSSRVLRPCLSCHSRHSDRFAIRDSDPADTVKTLVCHIEKRAVTQMPEGQ